MPTWSIGGYNDYERRAAPRLPTYRSDPAPAWRTTTPVERDDVIIIASPAL
jgi:hypothetical protein